jgi:hypothetical protein
MQFPGCRLVHALVACCWLLYRLLLAAPLIFTLT